jgi:hypothetical protein
MDYCLKNAWIPGALFSILLILWLHFPDKTYHEFSTVCPQPTFQMVKYDQNAENGQEILERTNCTADGFDTKSIIEINSHVSS